MLGSALIRMVLPDIRVSNVFMERFKEFGLVSAVFRPCNRPLSEVVYDISHLSKDGSGICNSHEAGAE